MCKNVYVCSVERVARLSNIYELSNMRRKLLYAIVLAFSGLSLALAQEIAYTEDGHRVVLYPNHTWDYMRGGDYEDIRSDDRWLNQAIERQRRDKSYYELRMQDRSAGTNAEIIVDGALRFVLIGGKLSKWEVIPARKYGWYGRPQKSNSQYNVKYNNFNDKLERVGEYEIRYDFASERVTKIGKYEIEYNFFNDKIDRIGNTKIEYGSFSDQITEIKGETPGLIIYLY